MSIGVHLHVHSEESALDGMGTIQQLVTRAKEMGFPALGLTDHGVCGGIPSFIATCEKAGIKPIPGCEIYITQDHRIHAEETNKIKENLLNKYGLYEVKASRKTGEKTFKYLKKPFNEVFSKLKKNHWSFDGLEQDIMELLEPGIMSGQCSVENPLQSFKADMQQLLDQLTFHQVLLAKNDKGLEHLYKITSEAHMNGFYGKPRISLAYIREHGLGEGIIATSACLGGYLAKLILANRMDDAIHFIEECKATFEHFYLEKQATYIPDQLIVNQAIDWLAVQTNTEKVLTTDVHYVKENDAEIHDVLVAMATKSCVGDANLVYAREFWMKSDEEMLERCNDLEAWANTMKIADMVEVHNPKEPYLPKFVEMEGKTVEQYVEETCWENLFTYCLKTGADIATYSERMRTELDVIIPMGFADYFAIVSDYISWAKANGYPVGPGRGSAAGSLAAMCLKITSIDPIKYHLMFERFLSPNRISYPDIDIDTSEFGGLAIFKHLQEMYGADRVAQIGTKLTMAMKSVCKDTGRALGYSISEQEGFAATLTGEFDTLEEEYQNSEYVRQYADKYPRWWEAMKALQGHQKSVGVHAGGVVLSPIPIDGVAPLRRNEKGLPTTQFDMKWIEKFLVKFDILKLETLNLIERTMEFAGIKGIIDLDDIDYDDPYVYENIYNKLQVSGVFQVESEGMKETISLIKPDKFTDLSAILALYRPGPMDFIPEYAARKHGKKPIVYDFESCKPILEETYGITVYQEQVMLMSVELGGLSKGQSDFIRKGISKKDDNLLDEWVGDMIYGNAKKNIPGAISKGYDEQKLLKLKAEWKKFGDYAFNKSHTIAYSKISYICAWLKAYYYIYFMAALISTSESKKDKFKAPKHVQYQKELKDNGIRILPPDIFLSQNYWTPIKYDQPIETIDGMFYGEIRFSLTAIAGVTDKTFESLKKLNQENIHSLKTFLKEVDKQKELRKQAKDRLKKLNEQLEMYKAQGDIERIQQIEYEIMGAEEELDFLGPMDIDKSVIENLIKAGAFDRYSYNRCLLLKQFAEYRGEDTSAMPAKTSRKDIADFEKEVLGCVASFESRWDKVKDGEVKSFTGIVKNVRPWTAKTGKQHFYITLDLGVEEIECTLWGYKMKRLGDLPIGTKITVKGEKGYNRLTVDSVQIK